MDGSVLTHFYAAFICFSALTQVHVMHVKKLFRDSRMYNCGEKFNKKKKKEEEFNHLFCVYSDLQTAVLSPE